MRRAVGLALTLCPPLTLAYLVDGWIAVVAVFGVFAVFARMAVGLAMLIDGGL